MGKTSIEWCTYTHNPWWGCDEIGGDPACGPEAGCEGEGCYARVRAENPYWWGKQGILPVWGQEVGRRFFTEKHYQEPFRWNAAAEKAGKPESVFCMSMGDWAEGRPDQKPILEAHIFPVIEQTPWLIWLLLTKRPGIAATIVPKRWQNHGWPANAWPGVTAVTQKWWDLRMPVLMRIPAAERFVSAEPLMERIDMSRGQMPSWVIDGGQSGKRAAPTHPDHFRANRDQAKAAGVAYLFKQWGEWAPRAHFASFEEWDRAPKKALVPRVGKASYVRRDRPDPEFGLTTYDLDGNDGAAAMARVGKDQAGRVLDGRTWDEKPVMRANV